jgi:mRNA-degrading endonuclease RelE of RelBE toxin-antitoxin system
MEFRISDTFTDSLARLTGDEQKAAKTTAFDLQLNPANPGMSFHKIDKIKDKNFWSVRVNDDIRLIVHKTEASLLLCYVDHHDKAYAWAERRKIETHPKTGAAQLVEIREMVKEVIIPVYIRSEFTLTPKSEPSKNPIFTTISDEEFLSYGVPSDWLADVRNVTENTLFDLTDHLPAEAAEALLELATGGNPRILKPVVKEINPFDHPDAQRRFRVMTNIEELTRALDFPWEKWTVFLHPEQRQIVERNFDGPARVSGSAGTGKTIVALHRAVYLARTNPEARVLLTTFSDPLANALLIKLKQLLGNEPRLIERIDVYSLNAIAFRLYKSLIGPVTIANSEVVRKLLQEAASTINKHKFSLHFLLTEWNQVVDGWQLTTWEDYRDVTRLGRKTRLPEEQRTILWSIFEIVRSKLNEYKLTTYSCLFRELTDIISKKNRPIFDFAVIDESQDISIAHIRFFAALGGGRPEALFFAGDIGQRIFQQPFSWKALGVDVRGRSRTLRVNYRTSHQIRTQADRLLHTELTDVDGNSEIRNDTVSVFNGPQPIILTLKSESEEIETVFHWILEQIKIGVLAHEFGIFVRSEKQIYRAQDAIKRAGLTSKVLDKHVETTSGYASICTMPLAKGLEFRAVIVMACDDEVIPLQSRIETVGDESDLQEVYDTERHLLYVACTRARDYLLITGVEPVSEFLDDLRMNI